MLQWFFVLCMMAPFMPSRGQYNCNAFANSTRSQEFVTTGGTVPAGTPCCFPFIYRGQVYNECTTRDNPRAWCAVESVYQENNKLWGLCRRIATPAPPPVQYNCNAFANSTRSQEYVTSGGTVPSETPCCFPFVYRGQVYYECTTRDNTGAWCAVESVYQENYKLWGYCLRRVTPAPLTTTTTQKLTHAPTSSSTAEKFAPAPTRAPTSTAATPLEPPTHKCNAFENSTRSQEYVTQEGTVPPGTPCCFPFYYSDRLYFECTERDRNQPWCAVESVYKESTKLWGICKWTGLTTNTNESSTFTPSPTTPGPGRALIYIPVAVSSLLLVGIVIIVVCIGKRRKIFCQKAKAPNDGRDLKQNPRGEEYSYIDDGSISTRQDSYANPSLPEHEYNSLQWQGSPTAKICHANSSPGVYVVNGKDRTSQHEYEGLHHQSPTSSPSNICMSVKYLTPPINQA